MKSTIFLLIITSLLISCSPERNEKSEVQKQYELIKQKEKEQQEWIKFGEKKAVEELQKINKNFYKVSPNIQIIASANLKESELNNTIKTINPEYGYVTYKTYSGSMENQYDLIIFKISQQPARSYPPANFTIEQLERGR